MKQVSVLTENKPGVLAHVAGLLGNSGVNIESITAETFGDGAVIRFLTKDVNTARDVLQRAFYKVLEANVLLVRLADKPGQLGRIAKRLADGGVNVENLYLLEKGNSAGVFAFKVSDEARATKILGKENVLG
ncbi:MAG: ACT domain-containing protein [Candidatus Micrarchaeota archaeon]